MSITDELRKYARIHQPYKSELYNAQCADEITAIADRIDAEAQDNERFRREAEPFCNRLREAAAEHVDVTLFGVDYTALPVDAEGEPIHVGDVMEVINGGLQAEACYMQIGPSGNWSVGLTKQCRWYDTESLRHRHEPTVEDVLVKMLEKAVGYSDAHTTVALNAIAEFAAKLRLAEGEDA